MKFSVLEKEIELKLLDLNDIVEFEKLSGVFLSSLSAANFPISAIRDLIFVAVKRALPEVTKEQVGACFVGAEGFEKMGEIQAFLLGGTQEANPPISG